MIKLCLDAGHGGDDPGAVGVHGTKEANVNLDICNKIKDKLAGKVNVVLTRTVNQTVSLQTRCNIANNNNCDLFISIHCNACDTQSVKGSEIYNDTGCNDKLTQEYLNQLVKFGLSNKYRGNKKSPDFYVINGTKMLAYLIETDFISNPEIENLLMLDRIQDAYANCIANAICKHFGITLGITYDVLNELKWLCSNSTSLIRNGKKDQAKQFIEWKSKEILNNM
jgi:N-acetylmuramoyl-L-alanine amidase